MNTNNGHTRCRFNPEEVAEMEALLESHNGQTPSRSVQESLAEKFSKSAARAGQAPVRQRQIWNWFQNRRYKLAKLDKTDAAPSSTGRTHGTAEQMLAQRANGLQFETMSAKDGAWYDVRSFLAHKFTEDGEVVRTLPSSLCIYTLLVQKIFVRYAGLGGDEDEWVELSSIRRRSLPCEGFECLAVYPGDNVLCFQEGDEHALYYDARVVDVQRKRHDARGCRCRFWIRYDHDQFEEVVSLRKVCRRPETDARLKRHFSDASKQLKHQKRAKRDMDEKYSSASAGAGGLSIDLNADPPLA